GAILATPRGFTRLPAIPVQERGAIGAGDSFLAGLVLGLARGLPDDRALGFAMAAGASAVATYGTARVAKEAVETLYRTWCQEMCTSADTR
ncbi:MAG TPA: PfkB family carbohydrate kinase, partial [Rhodopila sp.]|nr:PfkB family carbohydrate kinase [Rhodopila sp.]